MRCHYLSDLHLESQSFDAKLPKGDVLIIAGDLCHARCLDPGRQDKYSIDQRDRVLRFIDGALASFEHVLLVAGNHEHYDGVFEDTVGLLRRHLPGVTVIDNETVELGGIRFFGSTLWTNFDGRREAAMNGVRRRMGEFFFVKTRREDGALAKFQPEDALRAHDAARAALLAAVAEGDGKPTVVITHHAPGRHGLNPQFAGNGLDAAYASDLETLIAGLDNVPVWVHGHTHVARSYRVGRTVVRSNALGFAAKGQAARGFSINASFDL
jgi:Icc-related predicted phosphoesterase